MCLARGVRIQCLKLYDALRVVGFRISCGGSLVVFLVAVAVAVTEAAAVVAVVVAVVVVVVVVVAEAVAAVVVVGVVVVVVREPSCCSRGSLSQNGLQG